MAKVIKISQIPEITRKLKKEGKRIAFTNGCFDLLHPGHLKILKLAKKSADTLIVGLNSDSSIKSIKNKNRPVLPQAARAEILAAITYVDFIVIFNQKTPYQLIKKIRPESLIKGSDWPKNKIIGNDLANKVSQVKLKPGYSTTKIIEKIKKTF